MTKLSEKVLKVEESMQNSLLEREDEIHTSLLALLTSSHHFQYGEPGIAKSLLVTTLCDHISDLNGDYFQYLLTKFTTPEEINGIMDLNAFREEGVYRKITARKLPQAKIAFIDETFNGSSAILNTQLEILNERKFDRGDKVVDVPLISMFGASNHIPQSGDLAALADRLHFWHYVHPIQDGSNRAKLLKMTPAPPTATFSLVELEKAQAEVEKVEVGDKVISLMLDIYDDLSDEDIHVTDRRFKHATKVLQAEAWLSGRDEVSNKDLYPLQFMFWRKTEDIGAVAEIVMNKTSVIAHDARQVRSSVTKMMNSLKETIRTVQERQTVLSQGSEVSAKLSAAKNDVKELSNRDGLDEEDHKILDELSSYLRDTFDYLQREVFKIDTIVDPDIFS